MNTGHIILGVALIGIVILYFYTPKWLTQLGKSAGWVIRH